MTESLGQPHWMTAPETAAVFDALEAKGGADCARFVGGCVHNALIGQPTSDVDIAPLRHVADAFLRGRRVTVADFVE